MRVSELARKIVGGVWAKSETEKYVMNPVIAEEFAKILDKYIEALRWCGGSDDFSVDGIAHTGWNSICKPLLIEEEPTPPKNEIVKEGKIEKVEMMRSEEEKDPNYVDEFHDSLKKSHPMQSDMESAEKLSRKIEEDVAESVEKKLRGHPRFHELVKQMSELHSKKNHDYAGEEKPLNNLREVEGMGIPAWVGVGVRISDKYTRMKNFIKNRKFEFKEESFKDTMLDMAVYDLLCIILFEEDQKAKFDLKEPEEKTDHPLCPKCNRPLILLNMKADGSDKRYICCHRV